METKRPLISCVVAIYNVEQYLTECIESLMNQEYKNVEIILVNDGSTDKSLEICEEYAAKDSRITIINQSNQGANCARNAGLYAANGEWVYFADGDDYVKGDIFTYIAEHLDDENDIVMFSQSTLSNGVKKDAKYLLDKIIFEKKDDIDAFYELQLATMNRFGDSLYNYKYLDAVSIWNKCYRRPFLLQNSLEFIPKFPKCQDLSFNLRVYEKAKKGVFINHPGYVYRINETSVSNIYQADFRDKLDIMCKWFDEYMLPYENDERMREAYNGRILTFLRTSIVLYFCNVNNKKNYYERKQEFRKFLQQKPYNSAKRAGNISDLPIREKLLSWSIKIEVFFFCEMLNLLRNIVK